MSDEVVGAIVGGVIGLLGASIPLGWSWISTRFEAAKAIHNTYTSWLRGLIPELEHLEGCVQEIKAPYDCMANGGNLVCPTKELNTDFLAQARVGIIGHPRAEILFRPLTEAYRDCIHTNDMMRRFEKKYQQATTSQNPRADLAGILIPTAVSCAGVLGSVRNALSNAREQERLVTGSPPKLRQFLPYPFCPSCPCCCS